MKQIIAALVGVILASGVLARGQAPELQRIPFSAIQGVSVGNAQDDAAGTGVTVFRLTVPGRAAVAVFGGGPASRETEAIAPERNHPINALVFSGGSAYGLAASGGVARCIDPVFTTADGDTIYAVSVGDEQHKVSANLDAVGALSASLVEEAIADAVYSAKNGS